METNDKTLIAELRRDEGVEYSPYTDTVGIETVGVGHNLRVKPLADGWSYPLTDLQVDVLLASDLNEVFKSLDKHMPWWRKLSYPRQRVIANMAFNLGVSGLSGFKNTLRFIQTGEYNKAADGMLLSRWAKQVGKRANRLADMMVEG